MINCECQCCNILHDSIAQSLPLWGACTSIKSFRHFRINWQQSHMLYHSVGSVIHLHTTTFLANNQVRLYHSHQSMRSHSTLRCSDLAGFQMRYQYYVALLISTVVAKDLPIFSPATLIGVVLLLGWGRKKCAGKKDHKKGQIQNKNLSSSHKRETSPNDLVNGP